MQRQIRNAIIKQMPPIEEYLPDIWPKKEVTKAIKWYVYSQLHYLITEAFVYGPIFSSLPHFNFLTYFSKHIIYTLDTLLY